MGPKEQSNSEFSALVLKLEDELKLTVLDKLPQRAVQLDALLAKCLAFSKQTPPTQQQDSHLHPSAELVHLLSELQPVYMETAMDLHLIESKLRQMVSDVKLSAEVLTGEVLDRSLKLTEGLRRDVEEELSILNNFHNHRSYHHRKMLKYPALGQNPLAEFDRRVISLLLVSLAKCRNLSIALHGILSENLEHFAGKRAKKDMQDGIHSMMNH